MINLRRITSENKINIQSLLENKRMKKYYSQLKAWLIFNIFVYIFAITIFMWIFAIFGLQTRQGRIIWAGIFSGMGLCLSIIYLVVALKIRISIFLISAYLWKKTGYKRYKFYFFLTKTWIATLARRRVLKLPIDTFIDKERLNHLKMLDVSINDLKDYINSKSKRNYKT